MRPDPVGTLQMTRKGYGFVITPEGDWFIPRGRMMGAMDGDVVVVHPAPTREDGHRSGRIVRVMERRTTHVQGTYSIAGPLGVVIPLDPRITFDIFIALDTAAAMDALHPEEGDIVDVRILTYPSRHESALGQITEVIGHAGQRGIDTEVIIRRFDLETEFSPAAEQQASESVLDVDAALRESHRRDIRDRYLLTVDPVDARDFDDAVSMERGADGMFHLGVHIADVSHYVPWESSIDLDARRRATSVYLADRAIPMLPEQLSCNLCSLRPDEDRLAFTVDMVVARDGEVVSYEAYPSVVRSRLRLDYDSVMGFLDGLLSWPDDEARELMTVLDEFAEIRHARREARGGIDFDDAEAKVVLDDEGKVQDIVLRHRTRATAAIEEAMICANETVATFLSEHTAKSVYRVHDVPSADALAALRPLLVELDYPVEGLVEGQPQALQEVLRIAAERPEKELVDMRVLRSMKRAVYSTRNIGHYGLASECYCHFTSPIRRYPDLIVHRLLRAALAGCFDAKGECLPGRVKAADESCGGAIGGLHEMCEQLDWLCEHSSNMERVAADAAYDSVQTKLCEYMEGFIGKAFMGLITNVSASGLTVTLTNTVRGLVPIRSLGDEYFEYDDEHATLIGSETGTVWRIGRRVTVRLTAVSVVEMKVELALENRRA